MCAICVQVQRDQLQAQLDLKSTALGDLKARIQASETESKHLADKIKDIKLERKKVLQAFVYAHIRENIGQRAAECVPTPLGDGKH